MNEENINNNEENENMNNEELEELEEFKDFNDIIREHIVELIEMSKDEDVGSENQLVLNNLALNWYKEFSKTQVDAHRIVIEDESRRRDRESAEELKRAELEKKGREVLLSIAIAAIPAGIGLAGKWIAVRTFKKQQDRILAAEYIDDKYIMTKSFQMDYDALKAEVMKQ